MKYQVRDPQGNLHVIEGPDNATPDEVVSQAKQLIPPPQQQPGVFGNAISSTVGDVMSATAGMQPLGTAASLGQTIAGGLQGVAEKSAGFGAAGGIVGVPALMAKDMVPQTKGEVAATIAGGPLLEGMTAGGVKIAGKILPRLSSAITDLEMPVVERAMTRIGKVGNQLNKILQTDLKFITDSAVDALDKSIKSQRQFLGNKLRSVGDAVSNQLDAQGVKVAHPSDIASDLKLDLSNAGYKVDGFQSPKATRELPAEAKAVIKEFEELEEKGTPGTPARQSSITDAQGKPFVTPGTAGTPGNTSNVSWGRAWNLRKRIDDAVNWEVGHPLNVGTDIDAMLKKARLKLNERIYAPAQSFQQANNDFEQMARVYDFLKKRVLNGESQTVTNRVLRLLRHGSVQRNVLDKLDVMGTNTAGKFNDLLDAVTAGRFAPGLHPSLGRAAFNTGGGILGQIGRFGSAAAAGGVGGHELLGKAVAGAAATTGVAAATSPRINFRIMQASKVIAKELEKLGLSKSNKLAASLSAPQIYRAIFDDAVEKHINASPTP